MRRLTTATLAMLLIQAATGCDQETAPDGPPFQVRDSAGVTIYDNARGEWTEATAWRLSSEPTLTIGIFDGPEEYLLFQARGARRLSNGNILIANGGTHELRFYDPAGAHIRSVGGEGDGPGEFRSMRDPWLFGSDSIAIWDSRNARLTVFDINGELDRSFRLDPIPDAGSPRPQGILADNSLLVSATIRLEGPRAQAIYRDSILYAQHSLEGAYLATSIRRQGAKWNSATLVGGLRVIGQVPDAPRPAATVFGDRWYYGSGESWDIGVYSPDGALTHLFRRDEPNRPFTREIEDEDPELAAGLGSEQQAALTDFFASMPIPETFPPTGASRSVTTGVSGSRTTSARTNSRVGRCSAVTDGISVWWKHRWARR